MAQRNFPHPERERSEAVEGRNTVRPIVLIAPRQPLLGKRQLEAAPSYARGGERAGEKAREILAAEIRAGEITAQHHRRAKMLFEIGDRLSRLRRSRDHILLHQRGEEDDPLLLEPDAAYPHTLSSPSSHRVG